MTISSMASLFETGRIKRMRDIITMYPSGITAALGVNYGGFMAKCTNPEKFSVEDIAKLAQVLKIDADLIWKVVIREALENVKLKDISPLFTDEK